MTGQPRKRSLLAELAGRSSLLLAPLVIVILLLAAIPRLPSDAQRGDPRREARTFQRSLQERVRSWVPGLAILDGAPIDSADVEMLTRDLFARARAGRAPSEIRTTAPGPDREPAPARATAPAAPEAPPLPRLSGVLIDGPWRQAVLDGQVVREGGSIQGYQVIEISARSVQLAKNGRTLTLSLGEGS